PRRRSAQIAAAFLQVDRRGGLAKLDHVGVEAPRRTFGQDLAEQRTILSANVFSPDLREVFAERLDDSSRCRLAVMGVEEKLAFLLGLSDIGSGGEVEHLGQVLGLRVRRQWQTHCKSNNRESKASFQSCAPGRNYCRLLVLHVSLPLCVSWSL